MPETPILDLERDPPKVRRHWTAMLAVIATGVGVGLLLEGSVNVDPVWWFPLLYASVAFHEVGHLAAAKLVGMEAGGIAVGGLMIFKSGARWIWRFDWRRILSGGLAKPLVKGGDLRRGPYAWMVAGGPLATALLTGIAAIGARMSPGNSIWDSLLFLNLLLLAATMAPLGGQSLSDIPRLWQILRTPAEFRSWAAALMVTSEDASGVLPRDWNSQRFEEMLTGDPQRGVQAQRQMLAFYRKIDQGDEASALQHLENALTASGGSGQAVRQWCFLEAACSAAVLRGKPAAARVWLDRARRIRKPESAASIEAGIAQSEGRYQDALDLWEKSLAHAARRKADSGLARYFKSKITEYRDQCRQALAQAKGESA